MPHFFIRLLPPRPTFAADMTDDERTLMGQHATYMRGFFDSGKLLAYGPVLDPAGAFGVAVLEAADINEVEQIMTDDPSVKSGMNRYVAAPMRLAGSQAPRAA